MSDRSGRAAWDRDVTEAEGRETAEEVEAEFDGLDVDAPRVGIIMGSKSDMETMEKAGEVLEERGHPLRDPRHVGPPRARHRRRLLPERADARAAA